MGRYDDALESFNRALEIDPELSGAATGKASALAALGRDKDGVLGGRKDPRQ